MSLTGNITGAMLRGKINRLLELRGYSAYEAAVINGFVGTETEWLASLKGNNGPQGIQGEQGPQGIQGEQGPQGIQGEQGPRGIQGEQGPRGIQGEQGPQGEKGADGTMTFEDLTDEQKESLKGDKGDTGETGAAGADGTSVTVSSVSMSTADGGSNVVTFSDGKTLTVKNGAKGSIGPKGDTGSSVTVSSVSMSTADGGSNVVTFSDGKTLTVKNGAKGSIGPKGDAGAAGTSAYSSAVSGGYSGTETDFNSDLAKMGALALYQHNIRLYSSTTFVIHIIITNANSTAMTFADVLSFLTANGFTTSLGYQAAGYYTVSTTKNVVTAVAYQPSNPDYIYVLLSSGSSISISSATVSDKVIRII